MEILIINIRLLAGAREVSPLLRGAALAELPGLSDAYLLIEHGSIADYGSMHELAIKLPVLPNNIVDANNGIVFPSWCDSHTHMVFAASREDEFIKKLQGASYDDIAAGGGGILNSARCLNATSEETLYALAAARLQHLALAGTGAVEIKSGYGLSVEGEFKMLRVIKKLRDNSNVLIRSTFLAAHAYPQEFRDDHEGYLRLIIEDMLPVIARENLADYIDVFCEHGFFSAAETDRICKAGIATGLKPKLHVNQLNSIGGIEAGIKNNALSLDHLETLTAHEVQLLARFNGCATLLPTAAFFLRMAYQPARSLIEAGAAVTLASDYNPGSSPSGNMNFVAALSCIQMKMLPEEVINAGTINGAYAMGVEQETGSISIGKTANIILTKPVPSLAYLFYAFGECHIQKVMLKGEWIS